MDFIYLEEIAFLALSIPPTPLVKFQALNVLQFALLNLNGTVLSALASLASTSFRILVFHVTPTVYTALLLRPAYAKTDTLVLLASVLFVIVAAPLVQELDL